MSDFADVVSEIMDAIVFVDPDAVKPGGTEKPTIFTVTQTARKSIVEYIKDALAGSSGRQEPPWWIVGVGPTTEADFGIDNLAYWMPVYIHYIDVKREGHADVAEPVINEKTKALAMHLNRGHFTTFQRVDHQVRWDSSIENPVMGDLVAQSKVQSIFAGRVWVEPGFLVGESYY